MVFNGIWHVLTRRKVLDTSSIHETKLSKCLGTGDLTALGVGSTLGIGIYVLGGHVARDIAGPSVILSFLLAAIASVFAGLCYAEFGARVPRAGSAYIYSYVCVGEFIAFIIGWNLILEYVIGSASVSRGVSLYLDSILNDTLKETFKGITPVTLSGVADYFDLFAFGLSIFVGASLAFGLKYSSIANNIFTVLNICVVIFIIGAGAFNVSIDNWFIDPSNITNVDHGVGGFFPYGFEGTLKGAATCFFGFVGFDCIATTGEEVRNPRKSIPLSIILTLAIVFFSYFGVSAILTLMGPYFELHEDSPIPYAFENHGWVWAKWIVAIGGIFGMVSSLFGAMYPLPRILYAMASDGLIFRFLGIVHATYKSPIIGTAIAALLTGTMAGLLDLRQLVNMMSIGTLMAYTIVAACIVLLRYKNNCRNVCVTDESYSLLPKDDTDEENEVDKIDSICEEYQEDILMTSMVIGSVENLESTNLIHRKFNYSTSDVFKQLFNCDRSGNPTKLSSTIVGILITLYCLFSLGCGLCIKFMWDDLGNGNVTSVVVTSIFGGLMLISLIFTSLQPSSNYVLSFKVPLVPLIPYVSIFFNIYLMLMLDPYTWIRFGVWMAIGIPVYVASLWIYGRGTNYITYASKSSINGSLSYGIDNTAECVERNIKRTAYNHVDERTISDMSIIYNKREDPEIFDKNENIIIKQYVPMREYVDKMPEEVINNIPIESVNNAIQKDADAIAKTNVLSESVVIDYGEEIEMLDKVLKEAEVDSDESLCDYSMDVANESVDVSNENEIDNLTVDINPNQSVVAEVHREDERNDQLTENQADDVATMKNDETSDQSNVIKIDVSNDEVVPEPETKTAVEEDPPILKVSIPVPPPLNESYFSSPKPYVKNKTVKNTDRVHIKNDNKTNVDDKDGDIPLNGIKEKLNNIFESRSLQRGMSVNPRTNLSSPSYREMHRSEPDLQALIKREADAATSSAKINESLNLENNKINTIAKFDIPNNNNHTVRLEVKNDENANVEEPPVTKEDIKKKLETLFSGKNGKSPVANRPKASDEHDLDDAIKPKPKYNYTNTMKIKKELFNDVLKSIQENSKASNGEPHVMLKKTQSFAKADISDNNNDVR